MRTAWPGSTERGCVEDDSDIAELERDYLRLNGYQADIEEDGAEGLRKALSGTYDAVIVDLMLPNKSRYAITRKSGSRPEFLSWIGAESKILLNKSSDQELLV